MAEIVPPYMNKMLKKLEKEVIIAERKELKAKKDYEYAIEYARLCKEQYEKAKKDTKE